MEKRQCKHCGGEVKHYDFVKRIVKSKNGIKKQIDIERVRCKQCKRIYRILPDDLTYFKHYETGIIKGVINGQITPFNLEFEDYPSETTIKRWMKEYNSTNLR